MSPSGHSRWIYFLPILHLCACLTSMVGYLMPRLQYPGIVWTGIMLADFPISLMALALAWKYSAPATTWILIVGTLWWYLLSRGAELGVRRFKAGRATEQARRALRGAETESARFAVRYLGFLRVSLRQPLTSWQQVPLIFDSYDLTRLNGFDVH